MNKVGLLFLTVFFAVLVLAGCQPPIGTAKSNLAGSTGSGQASGVCLDCHTSNYGFTGVAADNLAKYMSSGHANGLRVPLTGGGYGFGYPPSATSGSSCSKCHTTDGFVSWTINPAAVAISGTTVPPSIANASMVVSAYPDQVSCFACHNPHNNWNMDPRVNMPVGIGSGMFGVGSTASTLSSNVFSGGVGNLCVNCHQDRTDNTKRSSNFGPLVSTTTITYSGPAGLAALGGSPHHGVQSDFLMGVSSAGFVAVSGANTGVPLGYVPTGTFASSVHYGSSFKATSSSPNDACVVCHVTLNTQNASGQVSSHAMYLTNRDAAGGSDNVAVCAACHVSGGTATLHPAGSGTSFQTYVTGSTYLAKIDAAKQTLLTFFGNPAYFFSYTGAGTSGSPYVITGAYGATNGAVQGGTNSGTFSPVTGSYTPLATYEWKKDWDFTSTVFMTVKVQQALWNFKVFSEDRSDGIHNPKYAAELLFDAITLINGDTGTNGTNGVGTGGLNVSLVNPWGASRP